jgi:MoaA/NifB/PqqE/SkfB family radical SAM enzyme
MFERVVAWLMGRTRGRPFEAFQIEVTSRCTLRCVMCPRVALADRWPALDLPWEVFQRIAEAFRHTQFVHLQGWGEPLLHPRLFDMIAAAKAAGCRVGFTTNGMLLDQPARERLVSLDVDLVAISIAGATRRTHEGIRVGSDFATILWNVSQLLALRNGRRRVRPKVELFFLMTKMNMSELPEAVDMAASLGADELVATNLDYVVTPEHDDLKAFACPQARGGFARMVEEAREKASRAGLGFRPYPLEPAEVAVCEANPLKILFVACDGWVSPCTYMGLAGRTDIPRYFDGRGIEVPRLRFGNILDQDLLDIWVSPAYRAFRRQFAARMSEARMLALGVGTTGDVPSEPVMLPPPETCRTCYKLYGL